HLLGYTEMELRAAGRDGLLHLVHPDDSELYQRLGTMRQILKPGRIASAQLRMRHQDGSWRWLELRMQTLTQLDGQADQVLYIAKGRTGQLDPSESLRDSERGYRLLAENVRAVVLSLDDEMQPSYISPSVQQVTGYNPD